MSIHSLYGNVSALRVLSQTQRLKLTLSFNKHFLYNRKQFLKPASQVIHTDSSVQPYNYEAQELEREQTVYLQDNFLKDNFNIVNSNYFKLVTLPSECNKLEELLWTNEFKNVLSRSSFLYDVSGIENSASNPSEISALSSHMYEDVLYLNASLGKQPVNGFDTVFSSASDSKQGVQGKASEEQLLHIINRLTYSLLNFFEKPHDYSIYHKNIVFQNNIKGVTIRGLNAYAQSMYLMRFYGFIHFAKVKVDILKITHHIEDGTVRVRWCVKGMPRHKLVFLLWKHKSVNWQQLPQEQTEWLDGFSIFSVGDDGLIYKHICDKMIPDEEQLISKNVDLKTKVLRLLGLTPRGPTAGTLNTLLPCCRSQDFFPSKKIT